MTFIGKYHDHTPAGYRSIIFVNRHMRIRMPGGVGAGGEKTPGYSIGQWFMFLKLSLVNGCPFSLTLKNFYGNYVSPIDPCNSIQLSMYYYKALFRINQVLTGNITPAIEYVHVMRHLKFCFFKF
jgi:hypothetical protein